ncbi:MAG: hypothetical protein HOA17_05160 [Candidatus Melainabacteria bacterium]|nr:hypothetical protein [Candidatus Melainabacteria bacterium]
MNLLDGNQTLALGIFMLCLPGIIITVAIFIKYVILGKGKEKEALS